ncbi:MAG: tRNA pseudouridine synthase A [Kofleriaceae bacterium]|nr:tRNA pseudouridine synthase A [Kofleriaceae bacterium]
MRYFIHLAYDGTRYCGWQKQPNGETVQGKLNVALSRTLSEHVSTDGCGRTDAGVHATDFYAHFSTEKILNERFALRLNSFLPDDITIFRVFRVSEKANARYSATSRSYEYYLHRQKNPFLRTYACQLYHPEMDWEKVKEATTVIPTLSDFSTLCRVSEDFKTNICRISAAHWDEVPMPFGVGRPDGDTCMRFTITSNRFLRGMVRMIVGSLVLVGAGRLEKDLFEKTVRSREKFLFGISAPPHGLYLTKVVYPDLEFRPPGADEN